MWFVLDNSYILPEYLVEFEYSTSVHPFTTPTSLKESQNIFNAVIESSKLLMNTYLVPKHNQWLSSVNISTLEIDQKQIIKFFEFCHIKELMQNGYSLKNQEK